MADAVGLIERTTSLCPLDSLLSHNHRHFDSLGRTTKIPAETGKDYRIGKLNFETNHWGFGREEFLEAQEKREQFWLPFIREQKFIRALAICGQAHLLSFAFRLKSDGFNVKAYSYMPYALLARQA